MATLKEALTVAQMNKAVFITPASVAEELMISSTHPLTLRKDAATPLVPSE